MPSVSVIIVNWNGEHLLADCLGSLSRQSYEDFEVVFVDNGSTDGSIATARALFPALRLVALGCNTGFAQGSNVGIREARGRFVVLLNNDTRVDEHFLRELVAAAEADPGIGMVAPKILSLHEPGVIDSVGGLLLTADGIGQGRGRGSVDHGQLDQLEEVLCPSGCAALYRREMLDDVGLLAEEFFAYCEDAELGLRGVWAGWKTVSAPRALVHHRYSASTAAYSPYKLRLVERNHYFLALRTFPLSLLLGVPFWTLCRCAVMAYAIASRRGKGAGAGGQALALLGAFARGQVEAVIGIPRQLRGRVRIRRIGGAQFRALLRRHRLPLPRAFLTE